MKKRAIVITLLGIILCSAVIYAMISPDPSVISEIPVLPDGSVFMLSKYFGFPWDRVDISQDAMDDEMCDYDALDKFGESNTADYHGSIIFYLGKDPVRAKLYLGKNLSDAGERALFLKDGQLLPNRISLSREEAKFRFTKEGETCNYELVVD